MKNNIMALEMQKALEEQAKHVDVDERWQDLSRQQKLSVLLTGKEVPCEEHGVAVVRWQGVYQGGVEAVPWATVSLRRNGKFVHGSLSPEGDLYLQEQVEDVEKIRLAILKGLVS